MTKFSRIKQLLVTAMQVAALGTALLGGSAAWAGDDLVLKGDAKCTACHDESDSPQVLAIGKTKHGTQADGRTPTCTSCHGESEGHLGYKGSGKPPAPDRTFGKKSKNTAAERNASCLSCHQGGKHVNWQSSTHANRGVSCTSCHTVHNGHDKVRDKTEQTEVCFACHKEQRAQVNRPSHHPVIEGKMACTSCHDVHSDNPKALIKSSLNDTCFTCHMEKRGPFVHNHQPVTEDCGICHNPHGTTVGNLLKSRPPFLCQECHEPSTHQGSIGSFTPRDGRDNNALARGCLNCHTQIHGSNNPGLASPSAQRFFR